MPEAPRPKHGHIDIGLDVRMISGEGNSRQHCNVTNYDSLTSNK